MRIIFGRDIYRKNNHGGFIMYIDLKEGVQKVKSGSLFFKTFGVLTIILLIPFLLCAGIAKAIFGVLLALDILFVLFILFICFTGRGSKSENIAVRERLGEDLKTFQNINKEFVQEFCTWYIEWQKDYYGKESGNSDKVMHLALNLHITKLPDMSVLEKCEKLYFSGNEISKVDKYKLFELAQKLDKSTKDDERNSIKKQIVEVMQVY